MKNATKTLFSRTSLAVLVMLFGALGHAHAATFAVPEIDPSMAAGGMALVGGMMLVLRGRRSK